MRRPLCLVAALIALAGCGGGDTGRAWPARRARGRPGGRRWPTPRALPARRSATTRAASRSRGRADRVRNTGPGAAHQRLAAHLGQRVRRLRRRYVHVRVTERRRRGRGERRLHRARGPAGAPLATGARATIGLELGVTAPRRADRFGRYAGAALLRQRPAAARGRRRARLVAAAVHVPRRELLQPGARAWDVPAAPAARRRGRRRPAYRRVAPRVIAPAGVARDFMIVAGPLREATRAHVRTRRTPALERARVARRARGRCRAAPSPSARTSAGSARTAARARPRRGPAHGRARRGDRDGVPRAGARLPRAPWSRPRSRAPVVLRHRRQRPGAAPWLDESFATYAASRLAGRRGALRTASRAAAGDRLDEGVRAPPRRDTGASCTSAARARCTQARAEPRPRALRPHAAAASSRSTATGSSPPPARRGGRAAAPPGVDVDALLASGIAGGTLASRRTSARSGYRTAPPPSCAGGRSPAALERRGSILIVHGLGEHSGRYERVAGRAGGARARGPVLRPARSRPPPARAVARPRRRQRLEDLRAEFAAAGGGAARRSCSATAWAARSPPRGHRRAGRAARPDPLLARRCGCWSRARSAGCWPPACAWPRSGGAAIACRSSELSHDAAGPPPTAPTAGTRPHDAAADALPARCGRRRAARRRALPVPTLLLVAGQDGARRRARGARFAAALPPGVGTLQVYDDLYHELFNESRAGASARARRPGGVAGRALTGESRRRRVVRTG